MMNYLKKIIPFVLDKRLFIGLFFSYIILTVVLTLTHECGHYFVARCLGYSASIKYGYTHLYHSENDTGFVRERNYLRSMWQKDSVAVKAQVDFPSRKEYESVLKEYRIKYYGVKYQHDEDLIKWGGPIETMLTGTIGLLLLFLFRKNFMGTEKLNVRQWLLVFIALFWVRQPVNMTTWLFSRYVLGERHTFFDELIVARYWNLPLGLIAIGTGIIGIIVLCTIAFYFIPIKQRFTFILGSLAGGIMGYFLWLIWLGPKIMP